MDASLGKILAFMLVLGLISHFSFLTAQVREEWVARYDGPAHRHDEATAIATDAAGNVYVTGASSGEATFLDYATVKYNAQGEELWAARYHGPGDGDDEARAIAVDAEGNVYVTGRSYGGASTWYDYATIKYDAEGNEVWIARYNGPANGHDEARALALDREGNVYVTGFSCGGTDRLRNLVCYDYATVKYDAKGNQVWVARYDGPEHGNDEAVAIAVDAEGYIYVTGRSGGLGTPFWDYATIKYNAEGEELWIARYEGPGVRWSEAKAIALDAEGNVYVTGWSRGFGDSGVYRGYVTIKYDGEGDQVWVARYGLGNGNDEARAIAVDAEGNVYVTGVSALSINDRNYATIKYSAEGEELWVARYRGRVAPAMDEARALALDPEGNVYVTGSSAGGDTRHDYATVKYDAEGHQVWVARYHGPGNGDDEARAIAVDPKGNVYVTGRSVGVGTGLDYATLKYSQ